MCVCAHKTYILFCLMAIFVAILGHYTFMNDKYSSAEETPQLASLHRISFRISSFEIAPNLAWPQTMGRDLMLRTDEWSD